MELLLELNINCIREIWVVLQRITFLNEKVDCTTCKSLYERDFNTVSYNEKWPTDAFEFHIGSGKFLWKDEKRNVLSIWIYIPNTRKTGKSDERLYLILQQAKNHGKIKRTGTCIIQGSILITLNYNVQIIGFTSLSTVIRLWKRKGLFMMLIIMHLIPVL